MADRIAAEEAAKRMKRLVGNKKVAKQLFEIYAQAFRQSNEEKEQNAAQIAIKEKDLALSGKVLKAYRKVIQGVSELADLAGQGNEQEAKQLANAVISATQVLSTLEHTQPELIRRAGYDSDVTARKRT